MSKIGKKPIKLPDGVEIKINGTNVSVKGSKGTLERTFPAGVSIKTEDGQIVCALDSQTPGKKQHAMHGLVRSLVNNMVIGVTQGFSKTLEVVGVGYKIASKAPDKIQLNIGFSHPVDYSSLKGVEMKVEANKIIVSGMDKEAVGQTAAEIRALRPPKHYKDGAGIRYQGENVKIKVGKKLAA